MKSQTAFIILLIGLQSCRGIYKITPCDRLGNISAKQYRSSILNEINEYYSKDSNNQIKKIKSVNCDEYCAMSKDNTAFAVRVVSLNNQFVTDAFLFDENLKLIYVTHELPPVY